MPGKQRITVELPWELYQAVIEAADGNKSEWLRQAAREKLAKEAK